MTSEITALEARNLIERRFASSRIPLAELLTREYPEETVFVVHVPEQYLVTAAELGNALDEELQAKGFQGFVTVRRS